MIQRLMNSKKNRITFIAAASVAAIVIVTMFFFINKNATTKKNGDLRKLQEETHLAELAFNDRMEDASYEEREQFYNNLKELFSRLLGSGAKYRFKELSELKSILKAYPNLYDDVISNPSIYSVLFGVPQSGQDNFDEFLINTRLGVPDSMVLAQFTYNLDPIYYYIEYNGERYHVLIDQSRDGYTEEHSYVEAYGQYLKFEQYDVMGTIIEYAYLTDDVDMTHSNYTMYFMEPTDKVMPDFWEFYISVLTSEDIDNRMLTPNRESKAFETEYDGFADLHPSFAENNPMTDYDGDGILDRVYRRYDGTSSENSVDAQAYLFLGNGNTVCLSKDLWGQRFETYSADITADGVKDIVFIQYNNEPDDSRHSVEVFQNQGGQYVSIYVSEDVYSEIEVVTEYDGQVVLKNIQDNEAGQTETILYYDGNSLVIRE